VVLRFEVHEIGQSILQDITNKIPITIFGGNQAAITLLKDPVSHSKPKHMDIKFYWQREQVEKNEITYEYIPSSENIADILRKPLPNDQFIQLRNRTICSTKRN
jgi:hypothetical protein